MRQELLRLTLGESVCVLRAYSTFYTLAFVLSPLVAAWVASRRGLSGRRALTVYAGALASGIVGARALDLFVAWRLYAEDPSRIWGLSFTGFSLYGGLVLATAAGIALSHLVRQPVWPLADSAVPGLVLGLVLMRVGCFLNGCCFGEITTLPWGVTFPPGTPAWTHQLATGAGGVLGTLLGRVRPVHPTQLYEMAGTLVAGSLALALMRRRGLRARSLAEWAAAGAVGATGVDSTAPGVRVTDGVPFLAFALGFTLVRLGNHFLRAQTNTITAPEWFYPVFYVALAVVIASALVWRLRHGPALPDGSSATGQAAPPTPPLPPPGSAEATGRPVGHRGSGD